MSINFASPATTDNYSTAFVPNIQANQIALAQWLDSANTTIVGTPPTYAKRYNRVSGLIEEYSGSAWVALATGYAQLNGAAFTAQMSINTASSTQSLWLTDLGGNGPNVKLTSAAGSKYIRVDSSTGNLQVINSAYTAQIFALTNEGNVTANSYTGAGTGLNGTAASLTVGTASSSNALNIANNYVGSSFTSSGNNFGISSIYGSGSAWYRAIFYNDGTNFYLLSSAVQATQSVANTATYGNLRPFSYSFASGSVSIDGTGAGTVFGGGIAASGNVSFNNTSSTTSTLQLASNNNYGGTGYAGLLLLTNTTSGASNQNKYLRMNSAGAIEIVNSAYSAVILSLDNAGNLTAGANVTAYSDERKKKNWRSVGSAFIKNLASLKSGIYDRTDCHLTQVGVGAQSLQAFLPEAVLEGEDGFLSVSYGNAALVACVELAREVVILRKRIGFLECAQ